MPEHTLKLIFTPVTDKNVELLRLLNTTLFPVRYNDGACSAAPQLVRARQPRPRCHCPPPHAAGREKCSPPARAVVGPQPMVLLGVADPAAW